MIETKIIFVISFYILEPSLRKLNRRKRFVRIIVHTVCQRM